MAEQVLLTKPIQCPACEQQVPLVLANPKLYSVESRESDRHVLSYRWLPDLFTTVVPHHYKLWQCPNCLFADFARRVDKDKPDDLHEAARTLFLDLSIEKRMVLDSLREWVPSGELDRLGAIAIHLASLLVMTLPASEKQIDHLGLGRAALRLAWLFREQQEPATVLAGAAPGQQTIGQLASATERLDQLVRDAGAAIQEVQRQGKRRGLELHLAETAEANPYLAAGDLIEVRLQTLQADVTTLQLAVLQDQQGRLASLAPVIPDQAGAVDRALLAILPLWPSMPCSERQCLELALESFDYAYQFEGDQDSVEQATSQVNLILDILIRLGKLERALEWTALMAQYAADTAADLQGRLVKGRPGSKLSAFDENVIQRKIAALGLTRQTAGERRRDILDMMLERDRDKIAQLMEQTSGLPAKEQAEAMAAAGIHDGVLSLFNRSIPAIPKERAGWFKNLMR